MIKKTKAQERQALSDGARLLGSLGCSKGGLARMAKIREQRRLNITKGK